MIAIKGMAMPDCCIRCSLLDGECGTCSIIGETEADMTAERSKDCPLIAIQDDCEDAVSRKAVLATAGDSCLDLDDYEDAEAFCDEIKELPPVAPAPEKGKWLDRDASGHHFYGRCSRCGQEFCIDAWYASNMRYCPNCGTEMENS